MSHEPAPPNADLATVQAEDIAAAKFIGITLTVLFFYSLVVMAYVTWWTKQATG